jgi:signal transduction histidine kinase
MQMNEKERLFDLLIHDMTGPLSIVTTSTANLLNKADRYGPLTDQQRRVTERILRNARKVQTLLREMIEIFRSEEGLFRKEPFSIEKTLKDSLIDALEISAPHLVEEACRINDQEEFQCFLKDQGIFLEITGKYCKSLFGHDQKKVEQILRNLLSNALKFRQKRMKVSIGGEMDLFISVEDDGRGIPQENQTMIFDRFARLENRGDPTIEGLGLGLTGVKTLVEAMGGKITLESREGMGTCFTVRIPPLHSD